MDTTRRNDITRRRFVQAAAGSALTLGLSGCAGSARASGAERLRQWEYSALAPSVALAGVPRGAGDDATIQAVRSAALSASDFSWLSRGDTVLIKPVCNSGNGYPATTDPVALRAMIGLLRERGAGRVLVADMSGVQFLRFSPDSLSGSTRALMTGNGLARSIEAAGGELHAFEEHGWDSFFDDRPLALGHWSGPLLMPNVLKQVDHVVLMPRCARHLLAGSTLGMKAVVGWWRHDTRLEYHHDAATLAQKTADANTAPSLTTKLRLVLTSATKVLSTFGPDKGYVAAPPTGLVIASTSLLAHDMTSLAWLLENRAATPMQERDGTFEDPNRSATMVNLANRVVVGWLGGWRKALSAETLTRYDHGSIWDDRVLNRAFESHGGVPRLEFVTADTSVAPEIQQRLRTHVALSG
jgi:uncharacterized protein (DUF362 family)